MSGRIRLGTIAGVGGGVVFGMLMAMMGMLPTIAGMVGSTSAVVGFLIHLIISAIIGAGFGLVFGRAAGSVPGALTAGAAYGVIWWVLGPLTLMPLMMGMGLGSQWNSAAIANAMPSLMGHVIYGLVTGFIYLKLPYRHLHNAAVRTA